MKNAENPEDLGLQDQCLTFLTSGPPMLPYSYNSNYQIVQTDGCHRRACGDDPRRADHSPRRPSASAAEIRHWSGDSIGRWEGDTLVVDTTNFNDGGGFYGDAGGNFGWDRNLHLIERLSLLRRRHAAVPVRDRQPDGVHAAVERRTDDDAVDRRASTNSPATKATTR